MARTLMGCLRLFVSGLIVLLLTAGAAMADVYTVSAIKVEAEADSAFEAQRQALADGQTLAAQRLVERMTLAEDRFEVALPPMDAETAAGLIAGLQIADEQRTSTLYRATLRVQFDPRELRNYFNLYGLAYVESQGQPVLVIPVFDGENGPEIFDTPWMAAWQSGGFENALAPHFPVGALRDEAGDPVGLEYLDISRILRRDIDALQQLAEAYGVNQIALVTAALREMPGENGITSLAQAGGELVRFGVQGVPDTGEALNPAEPFPSTPTASYTITPLLQVAAPELGMVALRLVEQNEDVWKREAIVRSTETADIAITVLFGSFREWLALQSGVAGASLVQSARLDALSPTGATMTLSYRGAIDQVRAELNARGVRLEEDPDLGWTVRSR